MYHFDLLLNCDVCFKLILSHWWCKMMLKMSHAALLQHGVRRGAGQNWGRWWTVSSPVLSADRSGLIVSTLCFSQLTFSSASPAASAEWLLLPRVPPRRDSKTSHALSAGRRESLLMWQPGAEGDTSTSMAWLHFHQKQGRSHSREAQMSSYKQPVLTRGRISSSSSHHCECA